MRSFILTIRCRDSVGIVAAVASALAAADAFIVESSHHGDTASEMFFMRTVFRPSDVHATSRADFLQALAPVVQQFGMDIQLYESDHRMKVVIAVSRLGHCLNHLLHKWHANELDVDIVGVVSNHEDMRRMVDWFGIPFHHLPMTADKHDQEDRFLDVVRTTGAELTVLARYMQVLSDRMCQRLEGRCINIHHSFLPSFKGARPYHQAHARGVKVVGATAHYVTPDLDEGPIIEQDVVRVGHGLSPEAFVKIGKDVENVVLARAVQWHAEHRVLLNGDRTVVFQQSA
ncbi:formyltetrahydrofolate deformylase [Verticiella sediminum]|uniref:Formyltetrahydrofolate deformylase n=1 Tax=Verticiella sediminum TaxID=1247510 RepID=A0A556A5W7_9BURK|nr:formyltetrahydrofolate deformylase [Verticiella sediminum]TSH88286.1 formyltetrahydrofolate deformylase [Verticiella sediminum]